jgi:hypothetical protein
MKEIPAAHSKAFRTSLALVLINPVYLAAAVLLADHFRYSNRVWARLVAIGILAGLLSLACGLFGKGRRRWILILASCVETVAWGFMAAGL